MLCRQLSCYLLLLRFCLLLALASCAGSSARADELSAEGRDVLDRFVGKWDTETTMRRPGPPAEEKHTVGRGRANGADDYGGVAARGGVGGRMKGFVLARALRVGILPARSRERTARVSEQVRVIRTVESGAGEQLNSTVHLSNAHLL